ncbi:hypothetical protein HY251_12190 [bacterium]|nr:hypothetical protein [bacterium]
MVGPGKKLSASDYAWPEPLEDGEGEVRETRAPGKPVNPWWTVSIVFHALVLVGPIVLFAHDTLYEGDVGPPIRVRVWHSPAPTPKLELPVPARGCVDPGYEPRIDIFTARDDETRERLDDERIG